MNYSEESSYSDPRQARRANRTRKWNEFKTTVYLWLHGAFYGILFRLGLGWKFSAWLCSIGKYKKFRNGCCMYCGRIHNET